ncbi:MAG: IS4 family transposase [Deltaproteobacteria bacterium]|nr:IS4 family transposase [Deltaproteobacteria bacterium]
MTLGSGACRRPAVEVLGLCDQQYHVRAPRPATEQPSDWWASHKRSRESQLWERAGQRLGQAPAKPEVRWVRRCDRGADIYEHLQRCRELGHSFVVRAAQDRAVVTVASGQRTSLFATARAVSALGECELELRARPQHPARRARLHVGATPVELCAPRRPGQGAGGLLPLPCTVVRVWEVTAPVGVEPLEGVLLCDPWVCDWEQALECVQQYATRWLIEDYHKALKSGLGAERLQLETATGRMAAIALMSVVAVRPLVLRESVRLQPEAPATEAGLAPLELEVLQCKVGQLLSTVGDVALVFHHRSTGAPDRTIGENAACGCRCTQHTHQPGECLEAHVRYGGLCVVETNSEHLGILPLGD